MDHPSYCAGWCKDPAVQAPDGQWMCQGCGLSLETRKARQRRVQFPYTRAAAMQRHPANHLRAPAEPTDPPRAARPEPETRTEQCTTCARGRVGIARWEAGVRSCTACEPLQLIAIQMHKGAEDFHLAVSPEQARSTRRRP